MSLKHYEKALWHFNIALPQMFFSMAAVMKMQPMFPILVSGSIRKRVNLVIKELCLSVLVCLRVPGRMAQGACLSLSYSEVHQSRKEDRQKVSLKIFERQINKLLTLGTKCYSWDEK